MPFFNLNTIVKHNFLCQQKLLVALLSFRLNRKCKPMGNEVWKTQRCICYSNITNEH